MRWTMMAVLLLALTGRGAAQDEQNPFGGGQAGADPFGGAPSGNASGGQAAGDPFGGGPVVDPFGGAAAGQVPAAPPPPAEEGQQPRAGGVPISKDETNPVVLAIRDMNPTAPPDLMYAVSSLFDIGRTDEAKFFLIKLIEAKPDRNALLGFYERYGESFFYRLRRDHRMKPEAEQFADAVLREAHQAARDPQRLRDLVAQLSSASPAKRFRAIDALRRVEYSAVTPLLEVLADPARSDEHAAVRTATTQLGDYLLEPMLGAMETPDAGLQVQAIQVLGQFRSPRALDRLVGPLADPGAPDEVRRAASQAIVDIVGQVPDRAQIEKFLYERASDYYDGMLPGRLDHEDRITLWTWDAAQRTSVPRRYEAPDASLQAAARLARDLHRISPDAASHRRLFLLTNLELARQEVGLDKPLDLRQGSRARQAAAAGVEALEDVLSHAMETRRAVPAAAAAELLGHLGSADLVQSSGGQPRTLVLALLNGDRRLRMAAAEAILRLDPQRPYAGSSYVTETLGYVVRTVGSRRALVAHPRLDVSQSLVGLLMGMGFEADSACTGREAFRLAIRSPDYEFALLSDALDQPPARETIQMFRKDPRTCRLAIGLMGRLETLAAAEAFAETDARVVALPRPLDETGMAFQAGRLLRVAGRELVGYDERLDQAELALDWLLRLTEHPDRYDFYDLHRQTAAFQAALSTPHLAAKAATLLGRLGSPEAQRALVTMASQHAVPLAIRKAAAAAFSEAVQRRGLLLTRDEILLQYDRYNRSEHLDVGTQQVLGEVLDAIEAPSQAAKTQTEPPAQATAAS